MRPAPRDGMRRVPAPRGWLATIAIFVGLMAPGLSRGDPESSLLGRVPVCGDVGDGGVVRLKCPDFASLPDIEVFRVPGAGPVDLTFDFVFAEAARPNELGVFRVDDVRGPVGSWSPAEPEYLGAALRRATVLFPAGSSASAPDVTLRVAGGDLLVFFIVNNGTVADLLAANPTNALDREPKAYFSLSRLNPDPQGRTGGDHFVGFTGRTLPLTQFGFEDLTVDSDWDFDDVVYTVFASLQPPRCGGPDRDGDGVPDVCDGCPEVPNRDRSDADGDLVDDACDVCTLVADFAQSDGDGDGLGDACSLEQCADGRDNDGDGLVDAADPWCTGFVVDGVARPRGARAGGTALVRGAELGAARRTVLVDGRPARVKRWRARGVRFVVPRLEPGVYPVQLVRDGAQSNRVDLFVGPKRRYGATATRRRLARALGDTAWWRYFDAVRRSEPSLANPYRLDAALRKDESAPVVLAVIRSTDVAQYGASPDAYLGTARRLETCVGRYVLQMPDDVLATQLQCAGYPGRQADFRLLPADLQLRILNRSAAARATPGCFPTSAYAAECRRALRADGVGDGTLAALGFSR